MRAEGITDTGPVRSINEDDLLVDPLLGLAIVADGMGVTALLDVLLVDNATVVVVMT